MLILAGAASAQDPPSAKLLPPVETPRSAWYDNPPARKIGRAGFFPVPPESPGYFSLWDFLTGDYREKRPKSAYPPNALWTTPFYDGDFRYIDDPKYEPDLLERLHRIHLGDNWLFGTGGQAHWRHVGEVNARLTGKDTTFDLYRLRVFGDLWFRDRFRLFAEVATSGIANQDLTPRANEEDRLYFPNLFLQAQIAEIDCQPVYVRAGRQELQFGSQRVLSVADWANVRRYFQGVRIFRQSDKFDVDLFWMQPIVLDNTRFNSIDHKQNLYGAWFAYHPEKNRWFDAYYLFLDNANKTTVLDLNVAPTRVHTLGAHHMGDQDGFLWDVEAMLQFGDGVSGPLHAGAASAGLGRAFKRLPMTPTVWAYYDWASGDPTPNAGDYNTYNQIFPQIHSYLGWLDLVGRRNIRDWNFHLYLYPTRWITFHGEYHIFNLDRARDALYGTQGLPTRFSPNGSAGGNVGQELDLIFQIHVSKRADILTGYSRLNSGGFLTSTGPGQSPQMWYFMYNVRW